MAYTWGKLITIGEQAKTIKGWSEHSGLSHNVIRERIKAKWPEDKLLIPLVKCGATPEFMKRKERIRINKIISGHREAIFVGGYDHGISVNEEGCMVTANEGEIL